MKFSYNGKEYTSKKELADALNVNIKTLYKYINEADGNIDRAIKLIVEAKEKEKEEYEYQGKKYDSMVKLADATGISRRTLIRLIEANPNLTIDEVVKNYKDSKKIYTYEGIEYKTAKDFAEKNGFVMKTVLKYLKLADDNLEEAMKLYYEEHTYAVIDGIRYSSQASLAEALGVSIITLKKYIDQEGSIEGGATKIKKMKENSFTRSWNGVEYTSRSSLANAMNIPLQTLEKILEETDDDLEKAYKLYQERIAGKYRGYKYEGKEFSSLKKLLGFLEISEHVYYARLEENDNDRDKTIEAILAERKEKTKEDKKGKFIRNLLKKEREKPKIIYEYKDEKYETIAALSIATGINETSLRRYLARTNNDVQKAVDEYNSANITYLFNGKSFDSIKALAEYTRINEVTLGRYLRRYEKDAEKAVFMIKAKDKKEKFITLGNAKLNINDLSIILGIKTSELSAYLQSGMTIDEIKAVIGKTTSINSEPKSTKLMYDEQTSLLQYCIDNGLNYSCIYYAIHVYGKTQEEAIENYKSKGQQIPKTWIFEKYGVLLKHLLLSENISIKNVVGEMRHNFISIDEALENCILKTCSHKQKLDYEWEKELYSVLMTEGFSDKEREEFIETFFVSEKELECICEAKSKVDSVRRDLLLFEMAECLQQNVFDFPSMVEVMKVYDVTEQEVEQIFTDFYPKFIDGVLLAENQDETIKRKRIINYTINLDKMEESEKLKIQAEFPLEYALIVSNNAQINLYKNALKIPIHDIEILERMKQEAQKYVNENSKVRNELEQNSSQLENVFPNIGDNE